MREKRRARVEAQTHRLVKLLSQELRECWSLSEVVDLIVSYNYYSECSLFICVMYHGVIIIVLVHMYNNHQIVPMILVNVAAFTFAPHIPLINNSCMAQTGMHGRHACLYGPCNYFVIQSTAFYVEL